MLSYLFHRIEDRLDGRPTLLIIDEGWLALDDHGFAGQLREWLKTLRKKNASVIFATQSLADIDGSAIAPAIIESCPTRLFLPNERALEPQIAAIYRRFGLNDRQIEILSRATPKRDYYCQSRRGNRLFELGLCEVALAFTAASSKTDQAAIAEILAAHGRDGFAAAWLRQQGPRLGGRHAHHPHPGGFAMTTHRFRAALAAGVAALTLVTAGVPAHAQWIVFDPTNFSQNVLTAARELQQINNEIQSLENQANMLINQAQNLASLPYSSLAQLEQSIKQTEQLLSQAQRIAYDVTTIDQAFTSTYPQAYSSSTSSPAARRRRADALAELARRLPGRHARAGRRGAEPRQHAHPDQTRWSRPASRPPARCRPPSPATSSSRFRPSSSPTSPPSWRRSRAPRAWTARATSRTRNRRSSSSPTSSTTARATSPAPRRCSTDARRVRQYRHDRPRRRASSLVAGGDRRDRHQFPARRRQRRMRLPSSPRDPAGDPLARELARCQTIGMAAQNDGVLRSRLGREPARFFTYRPAPIQRRPRHRQPAPCAKPEEQ